MAEQKQSKNTQFTVSEIPTYEALHQSTPLLQEHDTDHSSNANNGDQLPVYSANKLTTTEDITELSTFLRTKEGGALPILTYPSIKEDGSEEDDNHAAQRRHIINSYFHAITSGNVELVASFWGSKLVTMETTDATGQTPLLAAVGAQHVHMVRYLLDVGADLDTLAITATTTVKSFRRGKEKKLHTYRTPLQRAAELGNLPMVKLLMERGADDAIIAPDGQLALRLAASNGHREVVQYLPSRRGGGFRRWKAKHATAVRRCKKAGYDIYRFGKFIVFDIPVVLIYVVPKFLLWTVPKEAIVIPLINGVKWLHKHGSDLPKMLADAVKSIVNGLKKMVVGTLKGLKKLGELAWDGLKALPGFLLECVKACAKCITSVVVGIWKFIPGIPRALWATCIWLGDGLKRMALAVGRAFGSIFSFLHTVCAAIASFFQRITLKDVLNSFVACLRAIFVDFPKKLWDWTCAAGEALVKATIAIFGGFGKCIWTMLRAIFEFIVYIPKKIGEMLAACGSSIKSGGREIAVWFDPKRI